MKTLIADNINHKFIHNLPFAGIDDLNTIIYPLGKNIYELFYRYNFDYIIIDSHNITQAFLQFIVEFGNKIKCYALFTDDQNLNAFISDYGKVCKVIHDTGLTHNQSTENCIVLPEKYINTKLYNPYVSYPKDNTIACFLDNIESLPQELIDVLYPKTQLKIRLFNNSKFAHIQNLGIINETDRAGILAVSEYYIDLNGHYRFEAQVSKCKILDKLSIDTLNPISEEIEETSVVSYQEIIKEKIL